MSTMIALSLACSVAAAEGPDEGPAHALQHTSTGFLVGEAVSSILIGLVGPKLVLAEPPDPLTCADAWCEPPGLDVAVNRALALQRPRSAGYLSHAFTLGLTPAVAIGGSILGATGAGRGRYALQDTIILLDALALSAGINSAVKGASRRQRPAFYFGRESLTEAAGLEGEAFRSFYSGDTAWAWTLASGGTTLAFLRGYPHARWVAVGTGCLAFTGGYLRMSADMHWLTDVVVGTAAGVAIGAAVPLLLHRRQWPPLSLSPTVGLDRIGLRLAVGLSPRMR